MDVSIENTGAIGRRMTVKVPADELASAVTMRLKRLARTAKIAGFRPGKVPMKVIESRFADQALAEAADELISSNYFAAISDQSLEPAGPPAIEPKSLTRGEDLEFVANFEIFPEVSKTELTGMSIERQNCEVGDDDIDRTIDTLRSQRTNFTAAEKNAEMGDQVTVDFKGRVDGEIFQGGEANDYAIVLGKGALLKEFEDGLMGCLLYTSPSPRDQRGSRLAWSA